MFLNQRAAEFNFFTPSAPHRPIHSNLSGPRATTQVMEYWSCAVVMAKKFRRWQREKQ